MSDESGLKDQAINPTIKRLFDEGYRVTMFKSELGSYTAAARQNDLDEAIITDHFTPEKALLTIAEKVYGEGMYAKDAATTT